MLSLSLSVVGGCRVKSGPVVAHEQAVGHAVTGVGAVVVAQNFRCNVLIIVPYCPLIPPLGAPLAPVFVAAAAAAAAVVVVVSLQTLVVEGIFNQRHWIISTNSLYYGNSRRWADQNSLVPIVTRNTANLLTREITLVKISLSSISAVQNSATTVIHETPSTQERKIHAPPMQQVSVS